MFLRDLFEAPISAINLVGDFDRSSSFRHASDRKLVTNPKAIAKIKSMWKHPPEVECNIILVNHPDGGKLSEEGEVTYQWLEERMPRIGNDLRPVLDDTKLNIIYTNNSGGQRVPMTGWIMAHRLGHALWTQRSQHGANYYFREAHNTFVRGLREVMEDYRLQQPYLQMPGPALGFLREVCTFRSARTHNLASPQEALFEMLAQYMMTGRVRFNDIPRSFRYGHVHYSFRGEEYENANNCWHGIGEELDMYFKTALEYAEGHIYLM